MCGKETKYPRIDEPLQEGPKDGGEYGKDGRPILTKTLVIAGNGICGKTVFTERLFGKPFRDDSLGTPGFGHGYHFYSTLYLYRASLSTMSFDIGDIAVKLNIWDTNGFSKFTV